MPQYTVILMLLVIVACLVFYVRHVYRQPRRRLGGGNNPYPGLREQALRMTPESLQLADSHSRSPFGLLMELGVKGGTATLVAFIDGSSSIYFSSGGGVIGGAAHQRIRDAAIQFVSSACPFLARMRPVNDYPRPSVGDAIFYALTDKGVLSITAAEKQLRAKQVDIWPLYYAGQAVVTELRRVAPAPGDQTEGKEN